MRSNLTVFLGLTSTPFTTTTTRGVRDVSIVNQSTTQSSGMSGVESLPTSNRRRYLSGLFKRKQPLVKCTEKRGYTQFYTVSTCQSQ